MKRFNPYKPYKCPKCTTQQGLNFRHRVTFNPAVVTPATQTTSRASTPENIQVNCMTCGYEIGKFSPADSDDPIDNGPS